MPIKVVAYALSSELSEFILEFLADFPSGVVPAKSFNAPGKRETLCDGSDLEGSSI